MSDSHASSSTVWQPASTYVKRYWHCPVLVVVGIYVYQQYIPTLHLSTVE